MILKETILSAFDDRGTLLKWLKKVEEALKNAVLTDFSVEQISETEIKFKFTFENGDSIESPVLTLPRGEKGEQGAQGAQGKAASIRIGAVATGSPNTLATVSNSGTPEDAVLNFVIPQGEQGSAGVGFGDANEISINDSNINITAGDNGVNIAASFEIAVGEEIFEIPSTMYLPFKGSESIVIDVDESGDFIDIHLDADIAAKLGRVLVTPMSAPASVSLVVVDTSNAQSLLTIGEGLSVSGGVLSASGGEASYIHKGTIDVNKVNGTSVDYGTVYTIHVTAIGINDYRPILTWKNFVSGYAIISGVSYPVYQKEDEKYIIFKGTSTEEAMWTGAGFSATIYDLDGNEVDTYRGGSN